MEQTNRTKVDHYRAIYDTIFDDKGFISQRKTYYIAQCCGVFYHARGEKPTSTPHTSVETFSAAYGLSGYTYSTSFEDFLNAATDIEAEFVRKNGFPIRFELADGKHSGHKENSIRVEMFRAVFKANKLEQDLNESKKLVSSLEEELSKSRKVNEKLHEKIEDLEKELDAHKNAMTNDKFMHQVNANLLIQPKGVHANTSTHHLGKRLLETDKKYRKTSKTARS